MELRQRILVSGTYPSAKETLLTRIMRGGLADVA